MHRNKKRKRANGANAHSDTAGSHVDTVSGWTSLDTPLKGRACHCEWSMDITTVHTRRRLRDTGEQNKWAHVTLVLFMPSVRWILWLQLISNQIHHQWFTISTIHLINMVWVSTTPQALVGLQVWPDRLPKTNKAVGQPSKQTANMLAGRSNIPSWKPSERGAPSASSQKGFSTAGSHEGVERIWPLHPKKSTQHPPPPYSRL